MVAQCFGDKDELALLGLPGRGNGVGVGTFARVGGDEGKLPRPVAGPGLLQRHGGLQHTQRRVGRERHDVAPALAAGTNAPGPGPQRRPAPHQHQHGAHPANGLGPVIGLHQHHRVVGQGQVGQGDQAVRLHKPVVGKALDQGQHDEHGGSVKRPFAHVLRQAALAAQPGLQCAQGVGVAAGFARGLFQPAPAHHPLGALGPPPVQHAGHQGANAQPFVQAVHLVQALQARLQPLRAQCQQHGQAHQAHGEHTAELHKHGAKGKIRQRRG